MQINAQCFTKSIIEEIRELVKNSPEISRTELSRRICRNNGWRSTNGKLKEVSCRKVLVALERQGIVELPAPNNVVPFRQKTKNLTDCEVPVFRGSLEQLGEIDVEPIGSKYSKASKIWRGLLEKYHYLGSGPLCGAQIRYIVKSEHYGYVGALAFTSASLALKSRDEYIGWGKAVRHANLKQVISNARFLIIPTVEVSNLASYVLGKVLKRVASDWQERYQETPVLVETFVSPKYQGTCYKAANWQYIGETAGRRDDIPKKIFIYPLTADWREQLCVSPEIRLGEIKPVEDPKNWAEEEFGTIRFTDSRLKRRLCKIADDFFNNSDKNIPQACGNKAGTIGAYRFFSNQEVNMEVILTPHTEATIERIKEHKIVLAPQDTTTLDYSTHPMTEGLGPTNNTDSKSIGLILHDTLAFTEEGTPLGVLDAQCWARDPEDRGKKYKRKQLPIEEKESIKWLHSFKKITQIQKLCPETTLVSIGDRESDIYELFKEATQDPLSPKLLVRSEKSRNRKTKDQYLWDYMHSLDSAGDLMIHIPRSGSRKARDVLLEVRYSEVELSPPNRYPEDSPIKAWAVNIKEKEDTEGLEWLLLTTMPVENFKDACKRVEWYSARWGIEVYHRTLKSGCRIKDRQLGNSDRLEACLGVDMVVAWRVYHLVMLGREMPELPCTIFFTEIEWKALYCYANQTTDLPETPPTIKEAMWMVAGKGGFLGRKGDGNPGSQTLWRGLQKLEVAANMYALIMEKEVPRKRAGPG